MTDQNDDKKTAILEHLRKAAKKAAKKGGHAEIKVVVGKSGVPKFEAYVAEGVKQQTQMLFTPKVEGIHTSKYLHNMIKPTEVYRKAGTTDAVIADGGERKHLDITTLNSNRDLIGTVAELRAWFDENGDRGLLLPSDNEEELITSFGVSVVPAVSAKSGAKDYASLGGGGDIAVSAAGGIAGLGGAGLGNVVPAGAVGGAATELATGASDAIGGMLDTLSGMGVPLPKRKNTHKVVWDEDIARDHLPLLVRFHPVLYVASGSDRFVAHRDFKDQPLHRVIVGDDDSARERAVASLAALASVVFDSLVPALFAQITAQAEAEGH